MQPILIWLLAALLIIVVFVPYLWRFNKSQKTAALRKQEAVAMGIDRPRAQYPMVNRSLCIGCGACVAACPEGDVLAVVWGTAEVINGERCVGHGYCEKVCPVGALKVGLGDIKSRPDIPRLTPQNESTVPGLFIAGELGGLSLIRHAIAQGRIVVDEIARRCEKQVALSPQALDIIIVGAGPAGMSAALTAVKHRLSYLVIDERSIGGTILHYPRRKMVMTQPIEIPLYGWLKKDEYSKEFLLELWLEIVREYNINLRTDERVVDVKKNYDVFDVRTDGGTYRARHVVLALGRRGTPRRLDVPGEDHPKVMYQLIDAQSFNNKHLLVVGGGDSAVEAAVGLARQEGNTVSISYRKGSFARVKKKNEDAITRLIKEKKITAIFESQVKEIGPSTVLLTQTGETLEIPNDFVIVQIGGIPPFEMLRNMGIEFGGDQKNIAQADAMIKTAAS